jgi:sulfur-oxidizing protein SoxY
MPTRREVIHHGTAVAAALAGLGLLPGAAQAAWPRAAFEATSMAEALRALGAAAPVESREVTLQGPDIAENGAAVPVTIAATAPRVNRLLLLVEKNPATLTASFEPGDVVEPDFQLCIKMAESSNVYAVAILADGRVLFARREIRVTIGGCGE